MSDLPTGTVTFVFTDVEGSTRLLEELGAKRYAEALAEHRRLVREAVACHGGVEIDTQGDAFFVAFAEAADAVAASLAVQEALAPTPVRVRIGIHTGEARRTDEGYVGMDVHKGARIAAAGHGGQIVLSHAARERLAEVSARDLGEHRLKDVTEPVWLFQVGSDTFPPLKTISNTNLPRPASSFVGREREADDVTALIGAGARLVTLTGPGGSGKTRLAIEAAARLVGTFAHGVFWVGLATIRDPQLVVSTVAQTLGAKDVLAAHIGEKELLLLLDNLEQVVGAAPELAALVEACPNLRVLATSRELLRVRGEVEYAVLPLADSDAVALFCARARLEPTAAIGELCRRLDNMPLALELAAARTSALSPEQILERLARRLDLFKGGRDADPRQQTLRATIEWSHDLLSADEQRLFARLAVFAGGCTLESAETVCGADVDTLQALVEKSLVRHSGERFWMLETIREFALERLAASDEADEIRRRHGLHFVEIAEAANLSIDAVGRGQPTYARVLAEQDNLRAAIEWATEADVECGLRLGIALENFWITNDPTEGLRRLETLLERADGVDRALLARAYRDYGGCLDVAGDTERAKRAYTRSGELAREAGDDVAEANAIFRLGVVAQVQGDLAEARRLYEASLATFERLGDVSGQIQALGNLGWLTFEAGDREPGLAMIERARAMARDVGWVWWLAMEAGGLAQVAIDEGRFDDGEQHALDVVRLAKETQDRKQLLFGLAMLACAAAGRGASERAARLWATVEAEEPGPGRFWAFDREAYAARIPAVDGPVEVMPLDEAADYALEAAHA
ncbi:MAG: tetratricopeptide repeat protein [Thermoleophilia bacterium]|nr:tetratricopeptide repeat protein [Thermoleophilia bacterium]